MHGTTSPRTTSHHTTSHHTTRSALPTLTWLAGGAFLVGALAACGDAADPAPETEPAAAAAPAEAAPAAPAPAPEPETIARLSTGVGVVATTDEGLTLYRFDEDSNDPATTACLDACTQRWIPLAVDGSALPGTGIDGALLGTLQRPDGTTQATLKGWPLYTFVGDTAPGQTNGEGVGGTWHAIAPDGRPAAVAAAQPAPAAEPAPAEPAPAQPYAYEY